MSAGDKAQNAAENLGGKAKETAGHLVGNDRLAAEGKADQAKAKAKTVVEDTKDLFKK